MSIKYTSKEVHALSDSAEIPANDGFVPDVSGVLACQLRGDASSSVLSVIAGTFYPFDVKIALATGTTGVTKIAVFHGRPNIGGS